MTDGTVTGALRLCPGLPAPHNLHSTRRDWAAQLAPGRAASRWPDLLASLYNQCGHAHRLCAQLAIAAAAPQQPVVDPATAAARLREETAREHLLRIVLDWPRLLEIAGTELAHAALAASPLLRATPPVAPPAWSAQCRWLEHELLQMSAAEWLRGWQAGAGDWLVRWCRTQPGWLAQGLHAARALDLPVALPACAALQPMRQPPDAHTGTWSRLQAPTPDDDGPTPWVLLGSRLADLVRLCLPDDQPGQGSRWLSFGAQATGPGQSLAWVETGRGLLMHRVRLADTQGAAEPCLASCQVQAPTDWNFHPWGPAARILARIDPAAPTATRAVGLLCASLDPCLPVHTDLSYPTMIPEAAHA